MNRTTTVFLVNKNVRAIMGTYEPGAKAEMFKTFDQTIQKGDLMVVTTDTRHKFTVIDVTEVDVAVDIEDPNIKVRWALGKLSLAEHNTIVEQENEAIERVKQAEFNRKRRELMSNLVGPDDVDAIKSLPIYANGWDKAKPAVAA